MKTISLTFSLLMLSFTLTSQEIGRDAVVASSKMNVLYRGLDNPIEIAVPGVKSDKVSATITDGTIKKSSNGWIATPGDQSESIITVLVDNKKVSEKPFRVKTVPNPTALFGGKNDMQITKDIAIKTETLDAELKDFLWDLKFVIKSFTLSWNKDNYDFSESSTSNKLTDKMKVAIANCKTGQKFFFERIKAVGPDGRERDLNPIIITIN
jgi:hypothetical protein